MQIVALIWVINLFFFALILFFVWSKITIIARKIAVLFPVIASLDELNSVPAENTTPTQTPSEKS